MRAIDADALKEQIRKGLGIKSFDYLLPAEKYIVEKIDSMTTIQPEQRWIPVTEMLPEDDTVVLVCGRSGGVYTAIHNNSKTWIRGWWKMNSKNHHCNPTAWMPLPEPYQPDAK